MALLKNEKGITMISLLIAFGFLIISLPLLVQTLKYIQYESLEEKLSVEHFFIFVRNDLIKSKDYNVKDNALHHTIEYKAYKWDEATLAQRNHQIVRRLRGGHEIYLTDVQSFEVKRIQHGIELIVTMNGGGVYTKKIRFYETK